MWGAEGGYCGAPPGDLILNPLVKSELTEAYSGHD